MTEITTLVSLRKETWSLWDSLSIPARPSSLWPLYNSVDTRQIRLAQSYQVMQCIDWLKPKLCNQSLTRRLSLPGLSWVEDLVNFLRHLGIREEQRSIACDAWVVFEGKETVGMDAKYTTLREKRLFCRWLGGKRHWAHFLFISLWSVSLYEATDNIHTLKPCTVVKSQLSCLSICNHTTHIL